MRPWLALNIGCRPLCPKCRRFTKCQLLGCWTKCHTSSTRARSVGRSRPAVYKQSPEQNSSHICHWGNKNSALGTILCQRKHDSAWGNNSNTFFFQKSIPQDPLAELLSGLSSEGVWAMLHVADTLTRMAIHTDTHVADTRAWRLFRLTRISPTIWHAWRIIITRTHV